MNNKQLPIIVICVVIVLVIIAFISMIKNKPVINTELENNSDITSSNPLDNISNDAISNNMEQDNDDIEIINSPYIKYSDSIIISNDKGDTSYRGEEELIPSKIYLEDTSIKASYVTDVGESIIIPIENSSSDDERIVFGQEDLIIYKTGKIICFGNDISFDSADYVSNEEFENVFYSYFILNDSGSTTYKVYKTNKEDGIEVSFICFDKYEEKFELCRVFVINDNKYVAPIYIGRSIIDNVYYSNKQNKNLSINDVFIENIPITYFYFESGNYIEVNRFADGSIIKNNELVKDLSFTLNNDYFVDNYPIDGKYNTEDLGENPIKYRIVRNETSNKIAKDGIYKVIKIVDNFGNAIIENEDGIRYLLGNY